MKRLQFRHNNEVFQNRTDVLKYFADIVDSTNTASTIFQSSLYAEPLVAKYLDENGNQQIILAIGIDSGLTPYHIIDSKEIAERLDANKEAIEAEVERAKDAEMALSGSIETEIARALEAERFLSGAVDTERDERIAADAALQTQITENIAKIVPVTENLGANVREEYVLKNAKGEELGSHIKIYKDSALVGAEVNYKGATDVSQKEDGGFEFTYGADVDKEVEYLYLIYRNENGGLSLVSLDFENFLMENEEGLGIKIIDHKITIKIKTGDKYLTTTEDGLQTIAIDEAIKEAVGTLSDNLTAKIDTEIERSTAADEYISGLTAEFSAATVAKFALINSAAALETERAIAAELYLSGAVDTERNERIAEDDDIKAEVKSNKINSKDIVVSKTAEGTSLTIQTDEVTLTKFASAATIYDTNVAVLGTLLRVKKVEPISSNVKTRYELQDAKGQLIGDPIEMPIESALVDVKQGKVGDAIDSSNGNYITFGEGDTTMNFVYRLEDGSYELVQVVVSEYFTDSHFGKGLNNQDGTVSLLEGDGNEYLVIGEDTIAVVGVNNAIAIAKEESIKHTDDQYAMATGYTDQRYNDSIAHTDTRVDDVVSSVDSLTNTIDTAIVGLNNTLTAATASMGETVNNAVDGMNANVNSAVEGMNATVNSAVEGFNTLLTDSVNGINNSLDAEIANRQNADNTLDNKISSNTTAISTLQSNHVAFSGSIISYVDNKVNGKFDEIGAAASAETKAKEYADNLNTAMSERVNALNGDSHTHTNKVELDKIAEGDKAKWDDAVSRLDNFLIGNGIDEVIDTLQDIKDWMKGEGVVATELTEAIAAEAKLREDADTALGSRVTALEGINHDAYKEADNALRNEISTLSGNIETTLITKTDALNNALAVVSSNVDVISGSVNNINLSIKELSGSVINITTTHTADINRLSGDVISYVNNEDAKIISVTTKNEDAIAVLNADKKTEGSVLYRIENEFEKSLITDGVPVTAVSPEDANKVHSLIRQITVNGEMKYYVMSDATEMYYVKPRTTETAPIEAINLNDYITSLETRIAVLEEKLSGFDGDIEQTMKNFIKSYLVGTENEIKIAETDNKLKIGFDDNAIFGETNKIM